MCACVCVGSEMKRKFHQNNAHEYQSKRNCPGLATPSPNAHKVNELNGNEETTTNTPLLPSSYRSCNCHSAGRERGTDIYIPFLRSLYYYSLLLQLNLASISCLHFGGFNVSLSLPLHLSLSLAVCRYALYFLFIFLRTRCPKSFNPKTK